MSPLRIACKERSRFHQLFPELALLLWTCHLCDCFDLLLFYPYCDLRIAPQVEVPTGMCVSTRVKCGHHIRGAVSDVDQRHRTRCSRFPSRCREREKADRILRPTEVDSPSRQVIYDERE